MRSSSSSKCLGLLRASRRAGGWADQRDVWCVGSLWSRSLWSSSSPSSLSSLSSLSSSSSPSSLSSSLSSPSSLSFRSVSFSSATVSVLEHTGGPCMLASSSWVSRSSSWSRYRFFSSLPDYEELRMPALSPTMSQGNIVAWKKKEGDAVQPGDVYCEVETDKATIEWEAQEEGWLAKILMGDGSQGVEVGVPVAVLAEEAGDVDAIKAGYRPGGESAGVSAGADGSASVSSVSSSVSSSGSSSGSPRAFPQHEVMTMPALSPTMAEGTLVRWKKAVGDVISAGDVLAEIETDKATMEWEAQEDGVLAQVLVAEGTSGVQVGTPVFVQVEEEAGVAAFAGLTAADVVGSAETVEEASSSSTTATAPAAAPPAAAPPAAALNTHSPSLQRVVASPYARKLAANNNVSLAALQGSGSGPNGRIVAADVLGAPAVSASAASSSAFTDIANSNIRKIVAQRLLESKQQIPHYYLSTTCRVDTVSALRAKLNASLAAEGGKLSMNDFVIKAAAMALKKVPEANAEWCGDFIRQYHAAHVSVAVQTPAGLMVPVVRNAEKKGLASISSDVKMLATKAKEGRLDPTESLGGTFTISNLGMFGVGNFAAIVNPPQACILAVGAAEKRVVVGEEPGTFEEATVMGVTLSCDHRVIDGAVGATWLAAFKGYIEDPASMLL